MPYVVIPYLVPIAFLLLSLFFFWLLHLTQERLERKWFKVRISPHTHRMGSVLWRSLAGGFFFSFFVSLLGLQVRMEEMWIIYLLALLSGLVRLSFLDLRVGMFLFTLFAYLEQNGFLRVEKGSSPWLSNLLNHAHIPSYLFFIGGLTLLEGFLLLTERFSTIQPIHILGSRGKAIGGYLLQRIWPIPLFFFVPFPGGGGMLPSFLSWWPILPVSWSHGGAVPLFVPVLIGARHFFIKTYPLTGLRRIALVRMGRGICESIFAVVSLYRPLWALPLLLLFYVLLFLFQRFREKRERQSPPYFSNSYEGLSVLAVLPKSPAQEMGIEVGDRVTKANGVPVRDESSFYKALQRNSAFCKLEVLNREGNITFPQRSLYLGEHHLLGLIFAPGEKWHEKIPSPPRSLFGLLLGGRFSSQQKPGTAEEDSKGNEMIQG
ncbi:conserved membrane hypothetical protein [[Clostridium] ultunense Esp]|nr:conserved membrane hypothetical protein [[Clostridium] ultunense Esp]